MASPEHPYRCVACRYRRDPNYNWLDEPECAAALAEVREEAVDMFDEVQPQVEGVERPVFYRGKPLYEQKHDPKAGEMRPTNKPVTSRRYSDNLLMFLLKALRPEKQRDYWKEAVQRPAAARRPRVDLSRLSEDDLEQLEQQARKANGLDRRAADPLAGGCVKAATAKVLLPICGSERMKAVPSDTG